MVLIADDVSKRDAPSFPFALEAELRPFEELIGRLRRSHRVTETRQAIRSAARRIETLSRAANRNDVANLASALEVYFGDVELSSSADSFDDARLVSATVDVLNAKLPGTCKLTNVSELEMFVNGKFQSRCEAAIVKSQAPEPAPQRWINPATAPWWAVDEAIDRSYEARRSDSKTKREKSEPAYGEVVNKPASVASSADLARMIAAAFPGIEPQPEIVEETTDAETVASAASDVAFDEDPQITDELTPETSPEPAVVEEAQDVGDEPRSVFALEEVSETALESPVGAAPERPTTIVEEPVAEVLPEAPTKRRRGRKTKAEPKPPKEKKSKRDRRSRKVELAAESTPIEPQVPPAIALDPASLPAESIDIEHSDFVDSKPVEPIVESSMLPKSGDSVLDREPTSAMLDGWDLSAADRDAWMEEHPEVLDNLRASFEAVKANPTDADAMLELAAAFDDYRAAAKQANRILAADLAGKLEELPWRFAEHHAPASPDAIDLLRLGVRGLIDLATGFYDADQLQSLLESLERRLAAVDEAAVESFAAAVDEETAPTSSTEQPVVAEPDSTADVAAVAEEAREPTAEPTNQESPPPYETSPSTNLLALYKKETGDLLATLEESLACLASDGANAEALDRAFMTAHTYVGAAATVGYTDCSRVAGYIESILERVLSESAILDESGHNLVRFGVELLKRRTTHDSLPPFVAADFSVRCAEWIEAQNVGLVAKDAASESVALDSRSPADTQAFDSDDMAHAAARMSEETATIDDDEAAIAHQTAFDLLSGISDAEFELPDVPAELLEVYSEEAEEHLRHINAGLERLQHEPSNREVVQEVRRSAHTLKGAAGAVGLRAVAKLSHLMEDLLDELYEGARTVEPDVYDLLKRSTDLLGDLSSGVRGPASTKEALKEVFRRYASFVKQPAAAPVVDAPSSAEFTPSVVFAPSGDAAPARIAAASGEAPVWPSAAPVANKIRFPTTPAQDQTRRSGNMLRVPLERIDDLVRLVSELVINRTAFEQRMADFVRLVEDLKGSSSRLRSTSVALQNEYEAKAHRTGRREVFNSARASTTGDGRFAYLNASTTGDGRFAVDFDALEFDRYTDFHLLTRALAESTGDVGTLSSELANLVGDFDALLNRQSRLSRAIQDRLMRTRMVALNSLATRLHRTVRATADSLGKSADLEFRGEATELDKTVLEEMIDPLLHLLRNCVDHGVEGPEERRRAGKPEAGRIFIHAFYQGTQVVIQVGDDGRGIDPEALRAAAVRNGFLQAADAAAADLESLHQLLFAPGFSTAGEVSEISGRGVGLDIVRSRVAKLKGTIAVDSTPGRGTTFSIRLPMTLAIVRSLLVSAHGKTFAIPIQAVAQIVRVERSAVGRVADGRVIFHGGKVFSLFQLGKTLGIPPVKEEEPAVMPVLITYSGNREVAVQVDKIEAAREIVVKTLGAHLRRVHGMIGATLLGDGTVVPILNLPELYAKVRAESAAPTSARPLALATKPTGLQVMIIDDSVSVRRVVSTMIKGQGWTPIQAKDGVDGLEQLQKSPTVPDAILLDVEMPRMSGYELLAALRSQEKFRHVPIVMVTSRAGDKHRRKAMELGANEYTVKPFLEDALVALLRKLTGAAAKA